MTTHARPSRKRKGSSSTLRNGSDVEPVSKRRDLRSHKGRASIMEETTSAAHLSSPRTAPSRTGEGTERDERQEAVVIHKDGVEYDGDSLVEDEIQPQQRIEESDREIELDQDSSYNPSQELDETERQPEDDNDSTYEPCVDDITADNGVGDGHAEGDNDNHAADTDDVDEQRGLRSQIESGAGGDPVRNRAVATVRDVEVNVRRGAGRRKYSFVNRQSNPRNESAMRKRWRDSLLNSTDTQIRAFFLLSRTEVFSKG